MRRSIYATVPRHDEFRPPRRVPSRGVRAAAGARCVVDWRGGLDTRQWSPYASGRLCAAGARPDHRAACPCSRTAHHRRLMPVIRRGSGPISGRAATSGSPRTLAQAAVSMRDDPTSNRGIRASRAVRGAVGRPRFWFCRWDALRCRP
jgi:hypothetical protein